MISVFENVFFLGKKCVFLGTILKMLINVLNPLFNNLKQDFF